MKKVNCLVVDDEELARTLLENYISRLPHLNLVEKCVNPMDALKALEENDIDLIFLDIQMPEMSGIDFLKSLHKKPKVIFITAYSDYAIEGYQLDVVDYLLKPFSFERFLQAVNKAVDLISSTSNPLEKDYLLVKSEHKVHKIKYEDIHYIQSMREYVAYFLPKRKILALNSLKKLEEELPSDQFIRIHKSYIIPIQKVTTLEGNMVHIGNEKLPIGNLYKEEVLKRIF